MKKETPVLLTKISRIVIFITSIVGLAAIILEYGFYVSPKEAQLLHYVSIGVVIIFFVYQSVSFALSKHKKDFVVNHKVETILISLIVLELFLSFADFSIVEQIGLALNIKNIAFLYIVFAQIFLLIGVIGGGLRYNQKILQIKLHPSRLFILSFLITIFVGALLLMLPASTINHNINFVDALFTSTSAVCVTGLITVDTATYFTTFGQLVIMGLFQIGGLGLMTFTTFFAIFLSGGMGIKERIVLHDLLDEENIGAITKVLTYLTLITFIIEFIGAGILYLSVYKNYSDNSEAIFISIFHSVSAFCNAGFSLFTLNLMDPLVNNNYLFTATISMLIILGGIGFPTIMSLLKIKKGLEKSNKFKSVLPIQTSIILKITLLLLVAGTVFTFLLEYNHSLSHLSLGDKIYTSYFQSVTARTAGFNTIDFAKFTVPTVIFYLLLMFIGASPGGTGGGLKTTTVAVLWAGTISILRNEKMAVIGKRAIPKEIILKALLKMFLSILIITIGIFLLTIFENSSLTDISFESFSAFGTVGLSRGITGTLSDSGKLVITLLMFIGRVGPLAFIYSIIKTKEIHSFDLPEENISIL